MWLDFYILIIYLINNKFYSINQCFNYILIILYLYLYSY